MARHKVAFRTPETSEDEESDGEDSEADEDKNKKAVTAAQPVPQHSQGPLNNAMTPLVYQAWQNHFFTRAQGNGNMITFVNNAEREQCLTCRLFFPDRRRLDQHGRDFPIYCEQCGMCLQYDSIVAHATENKHRRCFVRGCKSHYRGEPMFDNKSILRHVKKAHGNGAR